MPRAILGARHRSDCEKRMLKKAREAAAGNEAAEGNDDTKPAMDSSQHLARRAPRVSRAQAEGMHMFENLVRHCESRTRQAASGRAAARGAAKAKVTRKRRTA